MPASKSNYEHSIRDRDRQKRLNAGKNKTASATNIFRTTARLHGKTRGLIAGSPKQFTHSHRCSCKCTTALTWRAEHVLREAHVSLAWRSERDLSLEFAGYGRESILNIGTYSTWTWSVIHSISLPVSRQPWYKSRCNSRYHQRAVYHQFVWYKLLHRVAPTLYAHTVAAPLR